VLAYFFVWNALEFENELSDVSVALLVGLLNSLGRPIPAA
jgi:hypothetical protein